MRIESFQVQGYANFSQPVVWGPLAEINVLYGPNNAGKTNLLGALELYLLLLGAGEAVTKAQRQILDQMSERLRARLAVALNRTEAVPIQYSVQWSLTDHDLERYGLFPETPCNRVLTELELAPSNRTFELRIMKWMMGGTDVAGLDRGRDASIVGFGQQVRRLLADARPFQQEQPIPPFTMAGAGGEPFPQWLRDALFDARQSGSADGRRRWRLFAEAAATLRAELGEGSWETTFDRGGGRADVVYLRGEEALTLESMGSGLQRFAGLLAELALIQEPWVGIEEPEWRLSPAFQHRLLRTAARILEAGTGPRQLFVSTHSPTIAAGGAAFALEPGEAAPTLKAQPWAAGTMGLDGDAAASPGGPADLGSLIGLVESLAEIDPTQLVAEAGAGRS
jgi:hypothetical protein